MKGIFIFLLIICTYSCSNNTENHIHLNGTEWVGSIDTDTASVKVKFWFTGTQSVNIWIGENSDFITSDYYLFEKDSIIFNSLSFDNDEWSKLLNASWRITNYSDQRIVLQLINPNINSSIKLSNQSLNKKNL